jgi:hypothetical protein
LLLRGNEPCDAIHWSIEDDADALWLYTVGGLVRITRSELEAWIVNPSRRIQTTVWDAADGVRLSAESLYFGPPVAKASDGKLWFHTGEGIQLVDPHHVAFNKVSPPVYIEQIVADNKIYWQNLPGKVSSIHLPALTRDVQIDYSALSLAAPEKVHFKYKLEGHYGLCGMRERATLIQGKLAVWSEVDAGTEVELRVPASAVYATGRKHSWWLRKFAGKTKA